MVWSYKKRIKNSNIEDKACCCKVNKMEIRYWKDDVISSSINIYNRLHPQTHSYPGIYDILLLVWGGEGGSILRNKHFLAARSILYRVKMHPGQEGWLKNVKWLYEIGHVWQANLPGWEDKPVQQRWQKACWNGTPMRDSQKTLKKSFLTVAI